MENPKYSIIIPTYNNVEYLPTCVNTILEQNYNDYELIISNNCSIDNTREYLESLKHSNIKIIQPKNCLSLVDHWNFAISHATGDWLICVGADDG